MNRNLLICVLIFGIVAILGCGKPTAAEVEAKIAQIPKLQRLDDICTRMPKPAAMKLVEKATSGNASSVMVIHRFTSVNSFESVRDFYRSLPEDSSYVITSYDTETRRTGSAVHLDYEDTKIVVRHSPRTLLYSFICIHESR